MDAALSTMKAADAGPAHLSWTGLAAKSESTQFSSGFILAHSFGKLVTKWIQISTHQELYSSTDRGEVAARLCWSRHHYFRRTADHFVADYRTFEFGGRNPCFKLTVFIKLLSVPTHLWNLFLSVNHSAVMYEWVLCARFCSIPPLQRRIKGGALHKPDQRKCTISHTMANICELALNMHLPYFKANDVHHFYSNLLHDMVRFIGI